MFFESSEIPVGSSVAADVCIVGSGAAGITLARNLGRSGYKVVLLEAGGWEEEPGTQAFYAGTVTDPRLHTSPDRYRQRRYGGTTTIWGGRCMPLDPIDFEAREYVPGSGWPFGPAELAPWYPEANELVEAGEFRYTAPESGAGAMKPMIRGFAGVHFSTAPLERFSRPTHFGKRFRDELRSAPGIQVLLHAAVVHVQLRADGAAVGHLDVANKAGGRFRVEARAYVLAAGGLESTRLMLASHDVHPKGIGNHHDVLGRYYMCHIAGSMGVLQLNRPHADVWHGYEVVDGGVYARRRLALTAEAQRANRIGSFIARLHHPRISDARHGSSMLSLLYLMRPLIPYEYARRLYEHDQGKLPLGLHVVNLLCALFDAVGFAWHLFTKRILASRKFPSIIVKSPNNRFALDFHAEQEPNPASRVTLGNECDPFGMPRLNIDWRYTEGDVRTVSRALELLRDDLARDGVATFEYDPGSVEAEMTRYGAYGGHHIGTIRMGTDPRTSMVDRDCHVHGVPNLLVAGSATFPTSSQANPTLTIVAMALRMAAHLNDTLKG
jgi:choline dehydrogenase-like flavoprotein